MQRFTLTSILSFFVPLDFIFPSQLREALTLAGTPEAPIWFRHLAGRNSIQDSKGFLGPLFLLGNERFT